MDITQILFNAQSADRSTRVEAENVLTQAAAQDFSMFLKTLCSHLAADASNPESRRLAGIIMKNHLTSHSAPLAAKYAQRWIQGVDPNAKQEIRADLLKTLTTQAPAARRAAAQVIATIATIDLPISGAWDQLIDTLLQFSVSEDSSDILKQASLETLGFVCEEAAFIEPAAGALERYSSSILTAVVNGMRYSGSPSAGDENSARQIRLAATVALNNAIEFAKKNFEVKEERDHIMRTLYNAALASEERIRQTAYEGLVRVAEFYYQHLFEYISGIHSLSIETIKSDVEPVVLQAIEFWSTVADEEVALNDEAETLQQLGTAPTRRSRSYIMNALPTLANPIFECLKMQQDDPLDDETWNRATAAGACLETFAAAAPNIILEPVMNFVQANINDEQNWRSREAALLAFGSVLEGPSVERIEEYVRQAMEAVIVKLVKDPHPAVQDTAAWTLGRMVQVKRQITEKNLPNIVEGLRRALSQSQSPVVTSHVCYAIHNLAECFLEDSKRETGALRDYTEVLLRELLKASAREDAGEAHLRTSAFEALNMMFRASAEDALVHVSSCVPILLEKLEQTIRAASQAFTDDDAIEISEMQGLLCSALTTATQRMNNVMSFSDRLMTCYLTVLTTGRAGAATEEALLAVAAVADAIGEAFLAYLSHFVPVVINSMKSYEQSSLCSVAVGAAGDLYRSLGKHMVQYSKDIMIVLLEALQSDSVEKTVKPPILSCLGDIAMGIKGEFSMFVSEVLPRLEQAARLSMATKVDPEDYDAHEFLLTLKESIFEGYVGIIHGLKEGGRQDLIAPEYVKWMLQFCEAIYSSQATGNAASIGASALNKSVAGVLGDLGEISEDVKREISQQQWVVRLLEKGRESEDPLFRQAAEWARTAIFASA